MAEFIHLHNHSHYSLQDGACTVDGLIAAAKKFNMKSVALTDHGVLYGIIEFYKKASKEGIKPILGMEAYVVNEGDRFERKSSQSNGTGKKRKNYSHLILLAKNKEGYKNLTKLSTLGHTEGFYYRPRIDLDIIKKYSEGLVCTSACAGGVVSTHLDALGLSVANLPAAIRVDFRVPPDRVGVVVRDVLGADPGVDALEEGDLVVEINRKPTPDVAAYRRVLSGLEPGAPAWLYVFRPRPQQTFLTRVYVDRRP